MPLNEFLVLDTKKLFPCEAVGTSATECVEKLPDLNDGERKEWGCFGSKGHVSFRTLRNYMLLL